MKDYIKPIILANEDLAEGVYAASGAIGENNCYTVTAMIHQSPEMGRGDYRIQINGIHAAANEHHSSEQILTIFFNQPVVYSSSNGELYSGDGTNTLSIKYNYHNNGYDNIGLGDVIVTSDVGLIINKSTLSCNYMCGQH